MAFDLATLGSVIGALGVGSVAGQWLAASKDRRSTRAEALTALAQVEDARWATSQEPLAPHFNTAARELRTRALMARLPRQVVDAYLEVATAAHIMSVHDAENDLGLEPEFTGAIDGDFADLVSDAARLVSDAIWSSRVWRTLRLRSQLAALTRRRTTMSAEVRRHLERAQKISY